jgi:hypothetical protein
VWVWEPVLHAPQVFFSDCVWPGAHAAVTLVHTLQLDQAPHAHMLEQVRVLVCWPLPHAPHAWLRVPSWPGVHCPLAPEHAP